MAKPHHDEDWLRERWFSCMDVPEIADEAGVTASAISHQASRYGFPTKFEARPYRDEDWLRERWYTGKSTAEIADEAGCDPSTVTEYAQKFGFPSKYRAEALGAGDRLQDMYVERKMSMRAIADVFDRSPTTIKKWLRINDIPRRTRTESYHARDGAPRLRNANSGYEYFAVEHDGEVDQFRVHQLLSIAEGAEPYQVFSSGYYAIHHKNGIPWDNRPSNIQVVTRSEHGKIHHGNENTTQSAEE